MRYQRLIIIILAVVVVTGGLELFFLRGFIRQARLAYTVFRVIDSETQAPIPDFAVTSPGLPGNPGPTFFPRQLSFLLGKDFSIVMGVATQPVFLRVSKGGYQDASFAVQPESYATGCRLLPGKVQTISLHKTPKTESR